MSFDCKYKGPERYCYRLKKQCEPGKPGCVLYGKFSFPFHDDNDGNGDHDDKKGEKKNKN